MRSWGPQEGESVKAFACFSIYRDLGPERTLREAAAIHYGREDGPTQGEYDTVKRWSRSHEWQERARAYDSWLDFERHAAVQQHMSEKAEDFAVREAALAERALEIREAMAEQATYMLKYPLTEQRVVEESEDGTEQTVIFMPAGWSKTTAVSFLNAVVGHAVEPHEEADDRLDYSVLSREELYNLTYAIEKVRSAPRLPPERPER